MTGGFAVTFTGTGRQGWGVVVTVPGYLRRRRLLHLDLEHVLVMIGALGVLATVAVALWGQV
jgi:hypothetical protein